jgi:hypothetical protein
MDDPIFGFIIMMIKPALLYVAIGAVVFGITRLIRRQKH